MGRPPLKMRRSLTRFPKTTKRKSPRSATRPLSGWMPISSLKSKNSPTSRRRLKQFATQLSPSFISPQEVLEACLIWEECPEACQEPEVLLQVEALEPDQPSKRSINLSSKSCNSLCKIVLHLNFWHLIS